MTDSPLEQLQKDGWHLVSVDVYVQSLVMVIDDLASLFHDD